MHPPLQTQSSPTPHAGSQLPRHVPPSSRHVHIVPPAQSGDFSDAEEEVAIGLQALNLQPQSSSGSHSSSGSPSRSPCAGPHSKEN